MRWLIILGSISLPALANAWSWTDLWHTRDQQGQQLMNQAHFTQAMDRFENNAWRAAAAYRAGLYDSAEKQYQTLQSADGFYNQGNALAHIGRYEEAIKAYDHALRIAPNHQDAQYNRKLIEDLLKQDQQQPEQQKQEQQKQEQQKQDQQKQNSQNISQTPASPTEQEKERAKQQWLQLIPDDPGGLMREKFLRDHLRKQNGWDQ